MSLNLKKLLQIMVRVRQSDKINGKPITECILNLAKENEIVGASVWQAKQGYGEQGSYNINVLRMAAELPILIEIVDEPLLITKFLPKLLNLVSEKGLVTINEVEQVTISETEPFETEPQLTIEDTITYLQRLVSNLKSMTKLLQKIHSNRGEKAKYLDKIQLLENESNSYCYDLLRVLNQDIFLPFESNHFSRLLYSLKELTDLLNGIANRISIGIDTFSLIFTNYANQMLEKLRNASKCLHVLASKLPKDWDPSWHDVRNIKSIEENGDKLHREFLDNYYKSSDQNLQEKDLDGYLENALDEFYKSYLYFKVFGSEYINLKENRLYLP